MERHEPTKIEWRGRILSIQVRATVWRYLLHNRTHREIGYTLFLHGDVGDRTGYFSVAISEKQLQNGQFRINDALMGTAWTKMYRETEYADYYRAGSLKRVANFGPVDEGPPPPWLIDPPPLETYSWRCARQLAIGRYKGECFPCVWANMSAVTIAWNFDTGLNKYRFESFCYGPKSCALYSMGKARGVSSKGRDTVYDTGDIDEDSTVHRGWDE